MSDKIFYQLMLGFFGVILMIIMLPGMFFSTFSPVTGSLSEDTTIVIDPGHGGFDGGATAGKVNEKDINLAIALALREMFQANGYQVIMTREEDVSTESEKADRTVSKKKSDMQNRLQMLNSNKNNLFISIHQNKFGDSSCSGSQVFYGAKNENSTVLAKEIQDALKTNLAQKNNRVEMKSKSNLYLLWNAKVPAVLVECGFLSNQKELAELQSSTYQEEVAFAIFNGTLNYMKRLESEKKQDDENKI